MDLLQGRHQGGLERNNACRNCGKAEWEKQIGCDSQAPLFELHLDEDFRSQTVMRIHDVREIATFFIGVDKLSFDTDTTENGDWPGKLDDLRHIHKACTGMNNFEDLANFDQIVELGSFCELQVFVAL